MAEPLFSVDVDTAALLAALDRLGPSATTYIKAAAKETADQIADEARRRLARQLGPLSTGRTLAGIVVREDYTGNGYIVLSGREPYPSLPHWIEKGTEFMRPRPYFNNAATLEEGPHLRRIERAVQQAINEAGFGNG